MKPFLSVIMPVHNGAAFLSEALENVLAQDYAPLEIVAVDDGSTDASPAILADYARRLGPAAMQVLQQANAGPAAARNRALGSARGELLTFLDADDLWPAGNLNRLVDLLLAEPEYLIVRGQAQIFCHEPDAAGVPQFTPLGPPGPLPQLGCVVFRRELLDQVGDFDPALRYGEDVDWFMRQVERRIPGRVVPEVTLLYRRHPGNMTRGKNLKEMNFYHLFKRSLDRRRAAGQEAA